MKKVSLALAISFCVVVFSGHLQAQQSHEDRIKAKLDEIKAMDDEESRTLEQLKKHLTDAIESENPEHLVRLRDEIASALGRRETLDELQTQLEMLLQGVADNSGARRRQPVPQEKGRPAQQDRGRPRSRAGIIGRPPSSEEFPKIERAGGEPDSNWRKARREEPKTRLDHLRESLRHLRDAGEMELARQIELRIKQEERRIAEENRRKRNRGAGDRRPPAIQRDGPAVGDDTRPANRRPARRRPPQNKPDDDVNDVIKDLRDEIKQLREELRKMQQEKGGK